MIKMDMHTHSSNFSDGVSDIITNLRMAEALQLDLLACTDHLSVTDGNSFNRNGIVDDMVKIVNENKEKVPFVLLSGAEAEILDTKGNVMITEESYYKLDFVLAHALHVDGLFKNTPSSKAQFIENHINTYINVAKNPLVDCIGHPFNFGRLKTEFPISIGDFSDNQIKEMAIAMKNTNTLFDMMNEVWWWYPEVTIKNFEKQYKRIINNCSQEGVKFITSSDSHKHQGIGNVGWSVRMLNECNVKEDQIFSLEDLTWLKEKHTR